MKVQKRRGVPVWTCYHNPDKARSRCDAPEEHPIEELIVYLEVHKVRVTELFNLLDRDHGSTVDLEEFKRGIANLGVNVQRVEELFAEIDTDRRSGGGWHRCMFDCWCDTAA